MFVSINFWFRPYEFLCLSLSFFEDISSILYIEEYLFDMVKIVSVSHPIFTFQNVLRNSIHITTLDQRNLASMRMYVSNSQ